MATLHGAFRRKLTEDARPDEIEAALQSYLRGMMAEPILFVLRAGLGKHRLVEALQHGLLAQSSTGTVGKDVAGRDEAVQAEIDRLFGDMHMYLDQGGVEPEDSDTAVALANMFAHITELVSSSNKSQEKPSVEPAEESSKHKSTGTPERAAKKAKKDSGSAAKR